MEEDGDGDLQGEGDAILHGNQQQSSKFRGVTWNKKCRKWQAVINTNGKHVHLGTFVEEEQAALVFDKAAVIARGAAARLNFPLTDYTDENGNLIHDPEVANKLTTSLAAPVVKRPRNCAMPHSRVATGGTGRGMYTADVEGSEQGTMPGGSNTSPAPFPGPGPPRKRPNTQLATSPGSLDGQDPTSTSQQRQLLRQVLVKAGATEAEAGAFTLHDHLRQEPASSDNRPAGRDGRTEDPQLPTAFGSIQGLPLPFPWSGVTGAGPTHPVSTQLDWQQGLQTLGAAQSQSGGPKAASQQEQQPRSQAFSNASTLLLAASIQGLLSPGCRILSLLPCKVAPAQQAAGAVWEAEGEATTRYGAGLWHGSALAGVRPFSTLTSALEHCELLVEVADAGARLTQQQQQQSAELQQAEVKQQQQHAAVPQQQQQLPAPQVQIQQQPLFNLGPLTGQQSLQALTTTQHAHTLAPGCQPMQLVLPPQGLSLGPVGPTLQLVQGPQGLTAVQAPGVHVVQPQQGLGGQGIQVMQAGGLTTSPGLGQGVWSTAAAGLLPHLSFNTSHGSVPGLSLLVQAEDPLRGQTQQAHPPPAQIQVNWATGAISAPSMVAPPSLLGAHHWDSSKQNLGISGFGIPLTGTVLPPNPLQQQQQQQQALPAHLVQQQVPLQQQEGGSTGKVVVGQEGVGAQAGAEASKGGGGGGGHSGPAVSEGGLAPGGNTGNSILVKAAPASLSDGSGNHQGPGPATATALHLSTLLSGGGLQIAGAPAAAADGSSLAVQLQSLAQAQASAPLQPSLGSDTPPTSLPMPVVILNPMDASSLARVLGSQALSQLHGATAILLQNRPAGGAAPCASGVAVSSADAGSGSGGRDSSAPAQQQQQQQQAGAMAPAAVGAPPTPHDSGGGAELTSRRLGGGLTRGATGGQQGGAPDAGQGQQAPKVIDLLKALDVKAIVTEELRRLAKPNPPA